MKNFGKYSTANALAWLMASVFAVLLAGCGGGAGTGGSGILGVSLTDAPACGFDKVYVTVNKVRVHQSSTAADTDAGWTDIALNPARKIDLLSLNNGTLQALGETPLAAGHYTQLRLVLDANTSGGLANSVVPTGTTQEVSLATPSAVQSGIKLINDFDVAAGQRVDLVLDFNACTSIVKRGNGVYALKPTIKVAPFTLNGIGGFIDPALPSSSVMVTAQQNGVVIQATAPKSTGEFFLSRLAPGNYDVVLSADSHATAIIASVPIASASSVVNVSTSGTPITLPLSVTHTVSGVAATSGVPAVSPSGTAASVYVAAKQALSAALSVIVKTVAADDTSTPPGAYALVLPAEAPRLGTYTATLPISFSAQSGVAGLYSIVASATGYQPQSAAVAISSVDATKSFALIP
ncbi:MAG: DUF4382 domain-containing protein [Nitrosomonadales bacterium]|nr:DUF4382 domain-containing protein [Nitrosomonadales bacterium]